MADNLNARYSNSDSNTIGPLRFVDIGGVFYAVSIIAQADGTLLSTFPVSGTVDLGAVDNAVLDAIAASVSSTDTILIAATSTNAGPGPTLGLQLGYIDEGSGNFYLVSNSNGGGLPVSSGAGTLSVTLDDYNIASLPVTGIGGGAVSVSIDDSQLLSLPIEGRIAHDSNISNLTPVVVGGRAYASAPADVSADDDVVFPWMLRNGSGVTNLAVGGTLVTGSAGLPVAQQGTWNITTVSTLTGGSTPVGLALTANPHPVAGYASSSVPSAVDDGDASYLWVTRNGAIVAHIVQANGSDYNNSNPLSIRIESQASTLSVALPSGASTATNQTTVQAPVTPAAATATKTTAIGGQYNSTPTTFTDGQQGIVQLGPAGSIRVSTDVDALSATCKQSTASNLKALVNINTGQTAHDSAATNDPVRIGAKAETSMSGITLVADGDATDIYASEDGAVYTRNFPAHPSDYIDATPTTITSSTADTSIVSAAAAGIRVYLTGVVINNRHATTKTDISLKDGSGGTVKAILPAPSAGGATYYFDPPLRGSAATAWHAACRDSIASIDITPIGYKSKV